ncbi:HNH endonuclease signature motif containing protein [Cyanobium gracile]|uniref:HNH endonuclease signature motif containing protein n=1 Tax=Cyanobium gracile UHCC 0281 TaxID=3110309 RepID=A0ABU5SU94_9CYAN|nr:HNH endonuclease signature motif containing protein [Cyanobium gracile]MEA5442104.1 HNH endonuclease signature motif containing protein [Cyanobium gracile UHCC 0281]
MFAHRSRHRSQISGSVTYRVPTRARGRCECCGAHEHQRALEVDHIVPRNHGNSDAIGNLEALCIAVADLVIEGQAMSFKRCAPRAMGNCHVQR